ncbi:MAG: Hsp20/alpha crystallin family protein [Bacillota bacterium]
MSSKLARFDPFNEIARFENFFKDFRLGPALSSFDVEPRIRMDVTESEQAYTVKAEIPGVNKEDIKVDIHGNQVSISAESKRESEERQGETVVRSERYYGQQYRSFSLPCEIDDAKAEARYRDGVLELSLPKKAGNGGRKLSVS